MIWRMKPHRGGFHSWPRVRIGTYCTSPWYLIELILPKHEFVRKLCVWFPEFSVLSVCHGGSCNNRCQNSKYWEWLTWWCRKETVSRSGKSSLLLAGFVGLFCCWKHKCVTGKWIEQKPKRRLWVFNELNDWWHDGIHRFQARTSLHQKTTPRRSTSTDAGIDLEQEIWKMTVRKHPHLWMKLKEE